MKIIFSFLWCLETVRQTLVTKCGDGATTSDQWQFVLSWPVGWQSPPGVKGALQRGPLEGYRGLQIFIVNVMIMWKLKRLLLKD